MQGMIFNAWAVERILAGRKTHTRRPMLKQPYAVVNDIPCKMQFAGVPICEIHSRFRLGPCYMKETHWIGPATAWGGLPKTIKPQDKDEACYFRQGFDRCQPHPWRPSIHMPEWASRCILDITRIWPERIQDISEEDAVKEGADSQEHFIKIWQEIYGGTPNAWEHNPWVWAYEFEVKEKRV